MTRVETSDGIGIHVRTDGDRSNPALIFSNSLGTDLHMWDGQADAAAERFFVVRYDQRGHGGSDAPEGPYTLERLGRDVLDLVAHLSLEKVSFCGLSMGGLTGLWLAAKAPERFSRFALCNTGAKIGDDALWNARITAVSEKGMAAIADGVIERWLTLGTREERPERVKRIRATLLATAPAGYAGCCAAIRDADMRPALTRIERPVLVISGAEDPATPPALGREIADGVRGARYVELAGCAHLSNIEDPAGFDAALFDFLSPPGDR